MGDKKDLEEQIREAFISDHRRAAEDEMKKKAILTAGSYDEFRQLVAASTLKPIKQGELSSLMQGSLSATAPVIKSRSALNYGFGLKIPVQGRNPAVSALSVSFNPNNASELERDIRRLPSGSLNIIDYLVRVGLPKLKTCLQSELDSTTQSKIILALADSLTWEDETLGSGDGSLLKEKFPCHFAAEYLVYVSKTTGFRMFFAMLDDKEREAISRIAESVGREHERICSTYLLNVVATESLGAQISFPFCDTSSTTCTLQSSVRSTYGL